MTTIKYATGNAPSGRCLRGVELLLYHLYAAKVRATQPQQVDHEPQASVMPTPAQHHGQPVALEIVQ